MFNFNKKKTTVPTQISINGTLAIVGYTPDPDNGKMFVSEVPDLTVLQSLNPKDVRGVKRLIVTAMVNDHEVAAKFGGQIIIVDAKFKKLSNKAQRILVGIENAKLNGPDSKFSDNFDEELTAFPEFAEIAAELSAMEEFGVRRTRAAISKSDKFGKKSENRVGKYIYKQAKKSAKSTQEKKVAFKMPELKKPDFLGKKNPPEPLQPNEG